MSKRDKTIGIISDRMHLISDIFRSGPQFSEQLMTVLSDEECDKLIEILEKLTDKVEEMFAAEAKASRMPMPEGLDDLADNEVICVDCEQYCKISWDENGSISGARCQMGMKAAEQYLAKGRNSDR